MDNSGTDLIVITYLFSGRLKSKRRGVKGSKASSMNSRSTSSSTTSSMISTTSIEHIIEQLRCNRNRDSTKRNYYCIWHCFNRFIVSLDRKPSNWADRLTLFVGFLINDGKKSSTIRSYVSGIKLVLLDINVEVNEDQFLISSLTRACKLVNDHVRTRLPIYKSLLNIILRKTGIIFETQPYLSALYQALFVLAYYGLLWVGEITAGSHPVKAVDVHIGINKCKILFILRASKTHWKDCKPQLIKIVGKPVTKTEKRQTQDFCPFAIIKNYLKVRGPAKNNGELFFVFSNSSPVKPMHMRSTLKLILRISGFDHTCYDTMSFRSGRASDLLKMGVSVETINQLGRWRSNAVFRYLR